MILLNYKNLEPDQRFDYNQQCILITVRKSTRLMPSDGRFEKKKKKKNQFLRISNKVHSDHPCIRMFNLNY